MMCGYLLKPSRSPSPNGWGAAPRLPLLRPPSPMTEPCPRRFTLLAAGGVRVTYACGAVEEEPDETAVDLEILLDRATYWTHSHRAPDGH